MKKILCFFILIHSFSLLAQYEIIYYPNEDLCESEQVPYTLVFEDNFDGNSLDLDKWIRYYPDGENGSDQCAYCRTHSKEGQEEGQIYKDENVRVENGSVFLDVKNEDATWYHHEKKYTSGMIHAKQTFNDYAKFEIRCKIPNGYGYWSAFWMFGWSTELDVFEQYGHAGKFESSVHFWTDPNTKSKLDEEI